MSTSTTPKSIEIMLRHPDASIRLAVASDLPLGELMPDFLDVAEQPDGDDWALSPDGVNPYPNHRTSAELGVGDGAVLVLYERPAAGKLTAATRGATRRARTPPAPAAAPRSAGAERPVSERTARTLPDKLSPQPAASGPWGHWSPAPPGPSRLRRRRWERPTRPPSPARHACRRWRGCAMRGGAPTTSTAWTSWC